MTLVEKAFPLFSWIHFCVPYVLYNINLNTISWCWCNRKFIILYLFIYFSLLLTKTLHLPRGIWWPIVSPSYVKSLITWNWIILGEARGILPTKPILGDTSRVLPLIQIHRTKVLTCTYILNRFRHVYPCHRVRFFVVRLDFWL